MSKSRAEGRTGEMYNVRHKNMAFNIRQQGHTCPSHFMLVSRYTNNADACLRRIILDCSDALIGFNVTKK